MTKQPALLLVHLLGAFLIARPAAAQSVPSLAWLNFNAILANPHQQAQNITAFGSAIHYPELQTAVGFGVEGGFTHGLGLGWGVRVDQVKHISREGIAVVGSASEPWERRQENTSVDIMATWLIPSRHDAMRVRVFGGPSLFHAAENQFTLYGHGYNAGADVAVFFSRYLGVGGAVRFNKGTAPLMVPQRDPAMEVGRLTLATGLRFRF